MLTISCCLWDANEHTPPNSLGFDESYVEKLYRGFKRNLTLPFRFVVLTDRNRDFAELAIEQRNLFTRVPHFGCLIEPFRLNDDPLMVCGLDMIVVRNIDHFAKYCLAGGRIAMPRDPYMPERGINPIVLAPAGHRDIYENWRGENDMDWLRQQPHWFTDDLFPGGQILSLKANDVRRKGLQNARIVYCHGLHKPHQLKPKYKFLLEHWV